MAERYVTYVAFDEYTRSETTADAATKHTALDAATIAVDIALKRRVELVTAGAPGLTARVFTPTTSASDVLWLDDHTELSTLVEDGTTLTSGTHFNLKPDNALSEWGEAIPYDRAVKRSGVWLYDGPRPTVTVTARWGWSAIPPVIVEGCKVIGKAMLETRNYSQGIVVAIEGGAFGARETKVVKDMIGAYRSHKSWGIG